MPAHGHVSTLFTGGSSCYSRGNSGVVVKGSNAVLGVGQTPFETLSLAVSRSTTVHRRLSLVTGVG
jgi:hypothetical protein